MTEDSYTKDSHPSERLGDRTGYEWSEDDRNIGIENRLRVAGAGDEICLREGTEDLMFEKINQVTWGDVMTLLCEQGVFEREQDEASGSVT